ncbi:MAG: endolytic transglycosylase MltG [Pseudomonadota bacterium]
MAWFKAIRLTFYFFFLVAIIAGYFVYIQAVTKPLENRGLQLEIPQGVGMSWLAGYLEKEGVIDNRYLFRAFSLINYREASIKAGEYTLVDVATVPELMEKVISGDVIRYSVTLVEGKRFSDYRAQLEALQGLEDEIAELSDSQVMRYLGAPGRHPEGQFAPQTYFYTKGDTDLDLLKQAFERQQSLTLGIWEQRDEDSQLNSAYELLILASIIEKETGVAHERPEIGGVFHNRLKIGMKLQTDPTVIYGMGDAYDGNIRRRDLTTDTEYNTYTRYGLPPTPIAMPGEAAIQAAANPDTTEALYFVGKGDGTHKFSRTLAEHNRAVIKYQLGGKPKSFSSNPQGNASGAVSDSSDGL